MLERMRIKKGYCVIVDYPSADNVALTYLIRGISDVEKKRA
jgi:hypothetical protein